MYQEILKKKLIPHLPGVYLFKNKSQAVIYIGKALDLKKRLQSYQNQYRALTPQKQQMLQEIFSLDYIVVSNEEEALLLEANLIQKHQPKYNIVFKDDKSYVYIKIDYTLKWPEIYLTRRRGSRQKNRPSRDKYFGPFTSSVLARDLLKTINKVFPVCLKPQQKVTARPRPCFNYQIHRCPGACLGVADLKDYQSVFKNITQFLKGNTQEVLADLKQQMTALSARKDYEKAAKIRDQLRAIEQIGLKQKIISVKNLNQDYLSLVVFPDLAIVHVFVVRHGKLLNSLNFRLSNIADKDGREIISEFMEKYYSLAGDLPQEIVINKNQAPIMSQYKIISVQMGQKKKLLDLGELNAREFYRNLAASWQKKEKSTSEALEELQKIINSKNKLERIECYDISNIQGKLAVGSMVVLTRGLLDKKQYRKFKINNDVQPNDVGMMREVISRRFRLDKKNNLEDTNWPKPDLVILDGGRPQLNMALKLFKEYKVNVPVLSLAKRQEEIYLPTQKRPLILSRDSDVLKLIQLLRDEAHRFAISYFGLRQRKSANHSVLDELPGIGPVLKKKILAHFGSVQGTREASTEDLEAVVGRKKAQIIKNNL